VWCDCRECKIFTVDGFSTDLHAFDLVNHKIPAHGAAAYKHLVMLIKATLKEAHDAGEDILGGYATALAKVLERHEHTTTQLIQVAKTRHVSELLSHSNEYMTFSGHLVIGWIWMKQGIIAHKKLSFPENSSDLSDSDRNFYLGKIAALDYICNVELPKTKFMAEIVSENPQVANMQDMNWHY
jgi:hypothetical protein